MDTKKTIVLFSFIIGLSIMQKCFQKLKFLQWNLVKRIFHQISILDLLKSAYESHDNIETFADCIDIAKY